MLHSLGSIDHLSDKKNWIPFTLNREGVCFFENLFKVKGRKINPKARLLFSEINNNVVPVGILVEQNPLTRVFIFSFETLFQKGIDPEPLDFDGLVQRHYPDKMDLKVSRGILRKVRTPNIGYHYIDPHFSLEMLWIELFNPYRSSVLLQVFSSTLPDSLDYQEIVCLNGSRLRGKRVIEIGVGTGANVLHALRFGASSVWGTDISLVSVFLCRWNIRYAEQTGQIPKLKDGAVRIEYARGFGPFPGADVYLFNTPAIGESPGDVPDYVMKDLHFKAFMIRQRIFLKLFLELRKRLQKPGTIAIWRLAFADSNELVEPINLETEPWRQMDEKFLNKQGMRYTLLKDHKGSSSSRFFVIEGKTSSNIFLSEEICRPCCIESAL